MAHDETDNTNNGNEQVGTDAAAAAGSDPQEAAATDSENTETVTKPDDDRLHIEQLLVGPMANYVYIIADRKKRSCVLVDPAWNIGALLDRVDALDYSLDGVLVTHYHPDHIGGDFMGQHIEGLEELLARRPAKIYIHKEEAPYVAQTTGLSSSDYVNVDGETSVNVGDIPVRMIHTPGHTPGSQCFLVDGSLVAGDTLFIGACGRVDLPGSNPTDLYYSLTQKLKKLPDDTILYPGHDYSPAKTSTIGQEKDTNPYMRFESLESYLSAMGFPG